ncbi:androgen-dependent TFPI-regulating protein [Bombyx mori]|uniref:Androgen-dependent TFPI-regulating protein n=1 Tax=Bombyx mori TaxID=7091 RepID=A0A8R2GA34_BOMMO|nr:androgen-dependent TFPI-regulating protein [Bombyx mori]
MFHVSCINLVSYLRISFHFVAFVHLVVTAVVTLSIDTTVDADPRIRNYFYIRWMLLTCWFNLIMLCYLPIVIYCEWNSCGLGSGGRKCIPLLKKIADVTMTSVVAPTTFMADIVFWTTMITNPEMMAPPKLFDYLPYWCQHSLHTVSAVVVIGDLILTPRRRPRNLAPRFTIMTAFYLFYLIVLYINYLNGQIVYNAIDSLPGSKIRTISLAVYTGYVVFFYLQWMLIDLVWR